MGGNATMALSAGMGVLGAASGIAGGAQLGYIAGNLIGAAFLEEGSEHKNREGPRWSDHQLMSASYGRAVPWVFGSDRVACSMPWQLPIIETRHEQSFGGGGKGGGGGPSGTNVWYTYELTAAFIVCRGPQHVEKLFINKQIFYHVRDGSAGQVDLPVKPKYFRSFVFYNGSETQPPSNVLVEALGADSAPGFRGITYFTVENMPMEDFGNRIPQFDAIVTPNRSAFRPVETKNAQLKFVGTIGMLTLDRNRLLRHQTGTAEVDWWDMSTRSVVKEGRLPSFFGFNQTFCAFDSQDNTYWGYDVSVLDAQGQSRRQGGVMDRDFNNIGQVSLWTSNSDGLAAYRVNVCRNFKETFTATGRELYVIWTNQHRFGGIWRRLAITRHIYTINPLTGGELHSSQTMYATDFFGDDLEAALNINMDRNSVTPYWPVIDGDGNPWVIGKSLEGTWLCRLNVNGGIEEAYLNPGLTVSRIFYHPLTNAFCTSNGGGTQEWSLDTRSLRNTESLVGTKGGAEPCAWEGPIPIETTRDGVTYPAGGIFLQTGDTAWSFYQDGWMFKHFYNFTHWTPSTGSSTQLGGFYDWVNHAIVRWRLIGTNTFWYFLDRYTYSGDITLQAIVDALCEEVGIPASERNTSDLAGITLIGFTLAERVSARASLEALRSAFQFDVAEIDYVLVFRLRSSATLTRTLTQKRLGFGTAGPVVERRKHEYEIPQVVELIYEDEEKDFQQAIIQARRGDLGVATRDMTRVELPVILTPEQATDAVHYLLSAAWCERDIKMIGVSQRDIDLAPMDVVAVELDDGSSFRMYLQDVSYGKALTNELAGVLEDPELQVSANYTVNSEVSERQVLDIGSGGLMQVMDIPNLSDKNGQGAHLHMAAGVLDGTFPGFLFKRALGSADFHDYHFREVGEGAIIGQLREGAHNSLNDANLRWTVWDRDTTFAVDVHGTLASTTESAVLDGANVLLVGDEIIQFVNATLTYTIGNLRTYTLDTLLRARKGTEYAINTHINRERVVVLTEASIGLGHFDIEDREVNNRFRGVTRDGYEVFPELNKTIIGRSLKPFAPVTLQASWNGNDVDLTWRRRARLSGLVDWKAGPSGPPLNETEEKYNVALVDGGGEQLSIDAFSQALTITAAQQTEAFGGGFVPGSDYFHVNVYQMSGVIGRGFVSETVRIPNVEL